MTSKRTARRVAIFCVLAVVAVILTMWARAQAVSWRGNTAWGGEALVPVYVVAAWLVWRTVKDWVREIKK